MHDVRSLTHEDLVFRLATLLKGSHASHKAAKESLLSESEQVNESIKLGYVIESANLSLYVELGGGELEAISSYVSNHVLADLDHQYAVIAFSSDRGMSTSEVGSELVDS